MTTQTRDPRERLREHLAFLTHQTVYDTAWLDLLDEALAAERRATVERIRERLVDSWAYDDLARNILAILDEEAQGSESSSGTAR